MTTSKPTMMSAKERAEKIAKQVNDYAAELVKKHGTFRSIPGFGQYEASADGKVVLSRKTGKVQQIPAGKKKYLIFDDKNQRRSIGIDEIAALFPVPVKTNKVKAPKAEKAESGPTKKEQILALHKQKKTTKEIAEETGISYNTVYVTIKVATIMGLHEKGKTVKEIAEITGFSEDSVKWQISK